ncbi:flagellar basal body-associated FliL family protein [Desulfobacter curvatus]|uniref:flagellar basal body-associated FliL family protein n=1 Tax=Desulfobacter curvatus TaxID=2290 RepID=UPI0003A3A67E|nr:flagellar basal body-associated FliL family protein [Desulfobacter curvatus]
MAQQVRKIVLNRWTVLCTVMFMVLVGIAGCGGEKEKKDTDLVLGNWVYYSNRIYILIAIDMKGTWTSSVRIADVTSKIVDSRGTAGGTWHLDEGQLIITVVASDINDVWEKDGTYFYKILELNDHLMVLEGENGRKEEWKKTVPQKGKEGSGAVNPIVGMAPYAVNLNKHSSNAQDRYLCLSMHLELMELMPEQPVPQFHPRARDAAIMYLSSLIYDDVSDFDRIKVQKEKVKDVLNPYMEGLIKDVVIDHVIIAVSAAKVEEFIIEHTPAPSAEEPAEGEDGKKDGTVNDAADKENSKDA